MKFTCVKENLIKGINTVARISGKNISLPILNNILIATADDGVEFVGTNLEIGIKNKIRAKIEDKGKITVPAKTLASFVNFLPDEKVSFELIKNSNEIQIKSGTWETKIKTQSAEDYPLIPEVERKNGFKIKAKKFKEALEQVIFAALSNEARPELSGGYISFNEKQLTIVATDSYRLAEKHIELSESIKKAGSFIVPIKTLQEIEKIISENDNNEDLEIYFEENQIIFLIAGVEINSRLINGQYPDYKQIIPTKSNTQIIINKNEILNAVKAASVFTKIGINDVMFEFKKPASVIIKAVNNQLGENQAVINGEINGDDNNITFNYHYILEGLANLKEEKFVLEISNANNPAILKPLEKKDYLYLIMPIRQ
ncbi:MAG TPA: DNA polymerase III subunit beta [bacterium]|nr:DNA polymerase III subunit beta [bacterium]